MDNQIVTNAGVKHMMKEISGELETKLNEFVFERNDEYTRMQIHLQLAQFLNDLKAKRIVGAFTVQCDSENNSPKSVADGRLNIDLTVRAFDHGETLPLHAHIVPTPVDDEERANRVFINMKAAVMKILHDNCNKDNNDVLRLDVRSQICLALSNIHDDGNRDIFSGYDVRVDDKNNPLEKVMMNCLTATIEVFSKVREKPFVSLMTVYDRQSSQKRENFDRAMKGVL